MNQIEHMNAALRLIEDAITKPPHRKARIMPQTKQPEMRCCDEMKHAVQSGTDRSLCGPAIHFTLGALTIGSIPTPVKFCPWCGESPE